MKSALTGDGILTRSVAAITGASSGIGMVFAQKLAAEYDRAAHRNRAKAGSSDKQCRFRDHGFFLGSRPRDRGTDAQATRSGGGAAHSCGAEEHDGGELRRD